MQRREEEIETKRVAERGRNRDEKRWRERRERAHLKNVVVPCSQKSLINRKVTKRFHDMQRDKEMGEWMREKEVGRERN